MMNEQTLMEEVSLDALLNIEKTTLSSLLQIRYSQMEKILDKYKTVVVELFPELQNGTMSLSLKDVKDMLHKLGSSNTYESISEDVGEDYNPFLVKDISDIMDDALTRYTDNEIDITAVRTNIINDLLKEEKNGTVEYDVFLRIYMKHITSDEVTLTIEAARILNYFTIITTEDVLELAESKSSYLKERDVEQLRDNLLNGKPYNVLDLIRPIMEAGELTQELHTPHVVRITRDDNIVDSFYNVGGSIFRHFCLHDWFNELHPIGVIPRETKLRQTTIKLHYLSTLEELMRDQPGFFMLLVRLAESTNELNREIEISSDLTDIDRHIFMNVSNSLPE